MFLGRVELILSSTLYDKHRQNILFVILVFGLLFLCVIVVCIHIIMEYILIRPLQSFNKDLLLIADGNYPTRLSTVEHMDLNASVDVVNSMAEKIERVIEEVSHTRDFLQNVLDSMPSVLIVVDQDACITKVNFSASKYLLNFKECIGISVANVFPSLADDIVSYVTEAISQGEPISLERKKCGN